MKKISMIFCFVFGLLILTSCGTTPSEQKHDVTLPEEEKAFYDNVKHVGRTYIENDVIWCGYSGTGVEFSFTGTECTIVIGGDSSSITANVDNHARIGIYVDGERVVDEMMDEKEKQFTVIKSETEQTSVVRVVKLTEVAMSGFAIKDIKTEGEIKPTENKEMLIEFIGDSITCGYGVDDENRNHHFSTKTEDVTRTYAYKTAEAMNADYSMVAISGYGIVSGYTTGKTPNSAQTLPQYYEKLGFTWGNFGTQKPQNIDWDFTKRQPGIIVINLGTNDDSYCKGNKEKEAEYKDSYVEFLKQIRKSNPDAKIVCTLGIMGDRLYNQIELAVEEYMSQTKDENIRSMKFDVQQEADGYAADWHPTEATNEKAAQKLVDFLKILTQ